MNLRTMMTGLLIAGVLGHLAVSQVAADTLDQQLYAHYLMDGNGQDATVNAWHANVVGAQQTTDRHGNVNSAYAFDGNDYLRVTGFDFAVSDWAVSTWIKVSEPPTWPGSWIFAIHSAGGGINKGAKGISLVAHVYEVSPTQPVEDRFFYGYYTTSDGGESGEAGNVMGGDYDYDAWHHIVFMKDGLDQSIWVDGEKIAQKSPNIGSLNINNGHLEIGGPNYWNGNWSQNGRADGKWRGSLDDMRVYTRSLTTDEIATLSAFDDPAAIPAPLAVLGGGAAIWATMMRRKRGSS